MHPPLFEQFNQILILIETLPRTIQFRFATKWEIFLMVLGVFFTLLNSSVQPLMTIAYAEFTSKFIERTNGLGNSSPTILLQYFGGGVVLWVFTYPFNCEIETILPWIPCRTNATHEESLAEMINDSIAYGILKSVIAVFCLVTGVLSVDMFNYTALKQVTRIRIRLFHSLIRQDIAWYDVTNETNVAVRIIE